MKYNIKQVFKCISKVCIGWLLCKFFSVFKIQNKVVFSNFSGKCYGDNPRYISEELHRRHPEVEICWLRHKGYNINFPDYITEVRWPSAGMFYHLATAKLWVDSHSKPLYVWKRKKQYYIETWHGGLGFKKIEKDALETLDYDYIHTSKHNVALADLFVSNSEWLTGLYRRAFDYHGPVLDCGYPKNDIFFTGDLQYIWEKVREKLKIDKTRKILLYAPTFRNSDKLDWLNIDLDQILRRMNENQLSGCNDWVILYKMHPVMFGKYEGKLNYHSDSVIDATYYPDMQELIIASDMFITDYSSGIFDFALLKRPCFIYAPDYDDYIKQERDLYFKLSDLPFPVSYDDSQLISNITDFDLTSFQHKLNAFFVEVGLKENGTAAETVVDVIEEKMVL